MISRVYFLVRWFVRSLARLTVISQKVGYRSDLFHVQNHNGKELLTFERSKSKFKVKTAVLKSE